MKDEMGILLDIYELVQRIWYLILFFIILFFIKIVSSLLTDFNKKRVELFLEKAKKYFESNRFNELLEFCKSKEYVEELNEYSLLWQGKAYIELSQFTKAKEVFLRLENKYPHLKISAISPYLKIINEREKFN